MRVRLRTTNMERKEAEAGFELSPRGHDDDGGVRRFLKGELVEVRQREKGLRGSWHPAVVIDVKLGRRVVEYDELLTDDRRQKLTEHVPVDRCLDGFRLGAARQTGKSPSKRPRTLLRPRPPPLPGPSPINWSRGLSVDCYFKDAWWEGILTEAINNPTRQQRALVWFPEEEDWEEMPLKHMRVGQHWDEDTGEWSLKGIVDIPFSKRGNRPKTMSLSEKSRGFTKSRRGRVRDGMKLAIALKIDGSDSSKDEDYTSAWNSSDRSTGDTGAVISVQLNSPKSASFVPHQTDAADRTSGDSRKEHKHLPPALLSRILDSVPQPLSCRSPRTRTRGDPSLLASPSFSEDKDNVASARNGEASGMDGDDHMEVIDQFRMVTSGETVDKENLDGAELIAFREWGRVRIENGNAVIDAAREVGQQDIAPNLSPEEEKGIKQLMASGWSITRKSRSRNGKVEWHYKSPNGCVLSNLASALGMRNRMEVYKNTCGDEENPTLSDIISPKSRIGSPFPKSRSGSGRMLKSSRRVGSPTSVKEGGQELDQLEPGISEDVNGYMVPNSGAPADSNGIGTSTNAGSAVVPLSSHSNYKRNASESEVIVDVGNRNDLKRRKVSDSPAEQNETRSSHSYPSNGGIIDGPEGNAGGGVSLESTPLTDGKLLGKSSDDGPATETRSKKRAYLTEGVRRDQGNDLFNARSPDDRSPVPEDSMEAEPTTKKSRVIIEASCSSQGKSRKSLAILQEGSRKKGSTPHKGGDSKSAKKGSTQVKKIASHAKKGKKSRTPSRAGVRLEVLLSAPGSKVEGEGGESSRKRTLLSWLIDNGTVFENEKVRYLHRKDLHCMLKGSVTRDGILCDCCSKIVTLSVFEAHAGSKLHRPSANIFLDDGRSLSVCQVAALAVKTQSEVDGQTDLGGGLSIDQSDDTCGICGDGGELICCDHCPSTFHTTCMGLEGVPEGDWYCPNCRCATCGGSQFNGDQTTFNDSTVILCDQCECEYHVKCLRARGIFLTAVPQDDFFCRDSCGRIFQGLRSQVGICRPMEDGFSSTLLRSGAEDDRKSGCLSNTELNAEHDSKLSIALSVMQECFRPMVDPRTKIDIITHVLYNRRSDVSRLNFHGFYTMLLERGDELISVATIRIHGERLAEMPLIGTRFQYRRQGMCRKLMSAIEEMLHSLGVEVLVLPAVAELLETWTLAFGFQPMEEAEKLQLMDLNIMAFPGTSILYKRLETVKPRSAVTLPSREVDHVRYEESRPRGDSGTELASSPVIVKRRPGRPPKVKTEINNWNKGVGAHKLKKSGSTTRPLESGVASKGVTVKRGPGRPPKKSKALLKPRDGANRAVSMSAAEADELAEAAFHAGYAFTRSDGFLGKASVRVTQFLADGAQQDKEQLPSVIRKKRGRPPRARISYNPYNGGQLEGEIEGRMEASVRVTQFLADGAQQDKEQLPSVIRKKRGRPPRARISYNPYNGGQLEGEIEGRMEASVRVTQFLADGAQQDKEQLPSVIRKKRGRPPRARISYNPYNGVLPTTATSIQVDQVARFHGGRIQMSTSAREQVIKASRGIIPKRTPNGRFATTQARECFDYSNSTIVPSANHTMREMKTPPMWLVESVHEEATVVTKNTLSRERMYKPLLPEAEILPIVNFITGNTKTYERRTEDDGSDGEGTSGRVDMFDEDGDHQPASERSFSYEAVAVPIRTFPSQFLARGEHNASPGAYIPVETIVVNNPPHGESLDELLVPESKQTSHSERDEQKCEGKLLLRLKLPKKNMTTEAVCDIGSCQPSPTASAQLSTGGLLPPAVPGQICEEVNQYEEFHVEKLKNPEPTMGSQCISRKVPVS